MARYFFHLFGGPDVILDEDGIEIGDFEEARTEVKRTIGQLQCEDPAEASKWKGWNLEVVDRFGKVALSISLDEKPERLHSARPQL
ncbi:DUF6894 family protein [Microvirga massiliensis]|uniref:DUF6894 family protein n=1 Tax=Microvirga massiliensis TaxID=1033741 RepID=UPI00062BC960|nr:hypothetical protein [Microvirga massiliensis]